MRLSIQAHFRRLRNARAVRSFQKRNTKRIRVTRIYELGDYSVNDSSNTRSDLTSEEKMLWVERQVLDIMAGRSTHIICPYCGEVVEKGEAGCQLLLLAMMAVVDKQDMQERIDSADQILEKHLKN